MQDKVGNKGNDESPMMILSSGKVVGYTGEQWKEVRDNLVKKDGKQVEVQGELKRKLFLLTME